MAANSAQLSSEWQSLLNQSADLPAQDNYAFPRVERNLPQLSGFAASLKNKTNKYRSLNNQIAATRLLAQQGFDASKLTQEVSALEVQPTIEDVFQADQTTSVEEYLRQIEESSIMNAIQEAQNQTVSAFDAHMEDCIARDWAANKRQLYGLLAPTFGNSMSGAPRAGEGNMPLIGSTPPRGGAAAGAAFRPALQLPPSEQAYVDVIKAANQALANNQPYNLVAEFKQACKGSDGKAGSETTMRVCWTLLVDMLTEARNNNVTAASGNKFYDALAAGARKHLERGHCQHMNNAVLRHKVIAERGADPDLLRQVQAYIQVKLSGSARGALDFQTPGGLDTAWLQVYFSLRNGWADAARRAAEHAQDVNLLRLGEGGFKAVLEEWLRNGGRVSERTAVQLVRACETLLHDKAALKSQIRQPYIILVLALLAGDARTLDALTNTLNQLQLPSVLSTIEDYMWCKLVLLQANQTSAGGGGLLASPGILGGGGGGASVSMRSMGSALIPPYTLADLQTDINRWNSQYYSKQGKEPLLYVMVLLLTLQFGAALRFLWQDDMTRPYRTDAVHLAIALFKENILPAPGSSDPGPDISNIIHAYGRKFVHQDSSVALQYYMLAAMAGGNTLAIKGQLLRELLTESRDFGTLLGGGSGPGGPPGGVLGAFVTDSEERKRLFEAVAYECQVAAQPEEAVELYLAADRPRQALAILNTQMSSVMPQAAEETATGIISTGAADTLKRAMMRGRDARERLASGADPGARREVEAYDQLCTVWELILQARKGRYDVALQRLQQLTFIPLEASRVEPCSRVAQHSLHTAVQERLPDILMAAADVINAQKAGATRDKLHSLRTQLEALCTFANCIAFRIPRAVYQKLSETAAGFS